MEAVNTVVAEVADVANNKWVEFFPGYLALKLKAFALKLQGTLDDLDGCLVSKRGDMKKVSSSWKSVRKEAKEMLRSASVQTKEAKKAHAAP